MTVKRIITNIKTKDVAKEQSFYGDILGMEEIMNMGFIATYVSGEKMDTQISIVTDGGSGAPFPDLSIEVDDLNEALAKFKKAGIKIEYGPVEEPWGVNRFFVKDPFGKMVNILVHA